MLGAGPSWTRCPITARLVRITLWIAVTAVLAGFVTHSVYGFRAPRDVPRDEAALFRQATRIAEGHSPYGEGDPVEVVTMPALPFALATLVRMFGSKHWELTLLSMILALLGALAVVRIVRDETHSATLGATSGAFLLLSIWLVGGSSTGQVAHALMMLLALAACLMLRWWKSVVGALAASLVLAAACFTHASGLWFALAALVYIGMLDRWRSIAYLTGLLVFVGGGYVGLSFVLGPWFNFHVWDAMLAGLRFRPIAMLDFLGLQLLGGLGVLSFATVLSFALPVPPWRGESGLWTLLGLAALGAGIGATQSENGPGGALWPAAVVLAIAGPIAIQRVTQHLSTWAGSSRFGGRGMVLTALALQLLMLVAHLPLAKLTTHA
jgi:hypothetical protein